ncbi:hypothetical protein C0993_003905 [Termitomyces sp. T159_Od127]|nr:hypothetical protein C0993_003905 [Termitomyces sp. T159_Od127]
MQCILQLRRVLAAMRLFRSGDIYADERELKDVDLDLDEALHVAFVMLLDDDGRNAVQLLLWARADVFIRNFVASRLYEGSQHNGGWPLDGRNTAHALWVMWLLTSEESLLRETPTERARIQQLLLPFVYLPARYAATFAPPNHFHLPPSQNSDDVFITPHGWYPVYHYHAVNEVYYDARCILAFPPAATAAKLLFLARSEVTPMPIARHFHRTRADRHASGIFVNGPTRENIEEFNWGWGVHLPLGSGLRARSGVRKMVEGWGGREWTREGEVEEPFPHRPRDMTEPDFHPPPPVEIWLNKSPHAKATDEGISKSRKWDADWNRMRFCGDIDRRVPRVPYGMMYEAGSIDGLWQGSQLIPGFDNLKVLLQHTRYPSDGSLTEMGLLADRKPVFVRLRELHSVEGESRVLQDLLRRLLPGITSMASDVPPFDPAQEHEGMMNGWLRGDRPPALLPYDDGRVLVRVGNEAEIYHCWHGNGSRRSGNDAFSPTELILGETQATRRARDDVQVQYEHDEATCAKCADRKEYRRLLHIVLSDASSEDAEAAFESDILQPWDLDDVISFVDEAENPPLPRVHDWERRGRGPCDGIRDILIVGEPDTEHAAAFEDYFFYGRVRKWDGMINLVRVPKHDYDYPYGLGSTIFYGYLVGGDTIVGNWRWGGTDPSVPGWEGTFSLGRRLD